MGLDTKKVADVIRAVAETQLRPAVVQDVQVEPEVDHDGDAILVIRIVLQVPENGIDPQKSAGFIRHLREPLQNFANMGFPIVSFMTPEEHTTEAA